ncbi:MAG TPA: hypothetical protein PLA90_03385 [Candidatus Sumerlaeota bacterium]|nr:hypothetical protein [Candidatus Sumerlaeota bacterium]HPS00562.1 hypothetical protein [Candidatus Sumerlaeota bacterium]
METQSPETSWSSVALEEGVSAIPSLRFSLPFVLPVIRSIVYSLLVSGVLFGAAYAWKLGTVFNFFPRFGFSLFPAILSYAFLIATARHIRACGAFSCMAGMMIGMTMGMVGGFLVGYYVGATNGMFVGSLFGLIIGIGAGVWLGARYGVMGFMEGVMAGFMSGPMGAMTAVMLQNDQVPILGVLFLGIGVVILGALNYMAFVEKRGEAVRETESHLLTVVLSLALTAGTIYLMVYGPGSRSCACHTTASDRTVSGQMEQSFLPAVPSDTIEAA